MSRDVFDSSVARRWAILFAAGGMMCGVNFIYDIPASLSTPLQVYLRLTDNQYGYLVSALYTAYAVPNFFLPFLSGFAVQRYGEKKILLLCFGVLVVGQTIFAAAVQGEYRSLLVFGRIMIGVGSEIPGVIAHEIVTRWFHGNTLSLALAILLCVSSVGSVTTSIIIPRLTAAHGVVTATWLSTVPALMLSLCCAACITNIDTIVSERTNAFVDYRKSLHRLSRDFWLLAIICLTTYGCLLSFNNSAQRFLASEFYGSDQGAAGLAVSIPNTLSGVLVLPFGLLLEHPRFKNYSTSILCADGLILVAHMLFLFRISGPLLPLILLGLGYASFAVAFWPAVASSILSTPASGPVLISQIPLLESCSPLQDNIVFEQNDEPRNDEENEIFADIDVDNGSLLVIGYGIMTSLLNLSMGLVPILLAIMESLASYSGVEIVFVVIATTSVFASARFVKR